MEGFVGGLMMDRRSDMQGLEEPDDGSVGQLTRTRPGCCALCYLSGEGRPVYVACTYSSAS